MSRIKDIVLIVLLAVMPVLVASASYTPLGLTERYSAPSVDSVPTNMAWHYNSARQMDYLVKPDGTVISNTYDSAGRLIAIKAEKEGGSDEILYAYDEAGRVGSITRAGNAIQYSYDTFLQTGETTPAGTISQEYNDDFRIMSLSLNGVMGVSYSYDDDGLLTQAGDLSMARDPASGFLTETTLGNVTDQRSYNGFGEVSQYTANVSGSPVYTVAYNYDALGRITNQAETIDGSIVNKSYVYDARGRLSSVAALGEDGSYTNTYQYDANGNRTNSVVGAVPRTAIFDSQDRQLTYGDLSLAYSLNGEQTNRTVGGQSTALSYDIFGQLASVSLSDGRIISYDKDALGRITAKRIDGSVVKGWIYKDGLKPIAETDGSGNVISFFVYASSPLTPDFMVKNGNTYRLIRDHVGSVRLVIDVNSGTIAQRLDYDSFGNILSDSAPGFQPFGFQSGLYDSDTGFVQFGARWYDPLTGRWLSKDSLLLAAGWNVYTFVGNNPIDLIDFNGEQAIEAYDYWTGVAVEGQDTGGVLGNLQTAGASAMAAFIDFWGARNLQSQAEQAGGAAGKGDSTQAWKHGLFAGGQIAAAAVSAFGGNNVIHPYYRFIGPGSKLGIGKGTWLARGTQGSIPYGSIENAISKLQIPSQSQVNSVIQVKNIWWRYISYPGRVRGHPEWGTGGGWEYRIGGF